MKKLFVFLLSTFPFFLFAQNTEGKITFTESVKIEINLPKDMEHLRDKLPSSQSAEKELLFTAQASLWRAAEIIDSEEVAALEDTQEEGNFTFKIKTFGSDSELYKGLEKGQQIEQQDFMGKVFLIEGNIANHPWKLTGATKNIAGYDCQQATFEKEEQKIEAWFSPQIPVASGPDSYGALPGMILELSIDEGQTLITATKVDLGPLNGTAISPPKKGKKISQEDFDALVAAKTKEMEEEMGGSNVRMQIRR